MTKEMNSSPLRGIHKSPAGRFTGENKTAKAQNVCNLRQELSAIPVQKLSYTNIKRDEISVQFS